MDDVTASIDDLIDAATVLVKHHTADVVSIALVRDDLAAVVADCADCADGATAADGCEVVMALERAMRLHERRHDLPLAS